MPVQPLEEWASSRTQSHPLSVLKDAAVGIDASYYLNLRINRFNQEPLLHALGGTPYCLKSTIEDDLQGLKKSGITPIFVFHGLDFINKELASSMSPANFRAHEDGWQHYLGGDAEQTVADFSKASYPVEKMYKTFEKMLLDHQVQFMVAPYSAAAQLSYLENQPEQFINAVMGPTDMFLFGLDKIILNFSPANGAFEWLRKSVCQEKLDGIPDGVFRDAQLLLGSLYLPRFPLLERVGNNKSNIRDALNLLNSTGRSVIQLCHQFRDDAQVQRLQYVDRYKKAIMTVKHHVVLETNGRVLPLDFEHAPGDVHEWVGQRLPEELYFYISKGMLGPQIPNWITSGEIVLSLPAGCGDSDVYQRLITDQLHELRTQSIGLLSNSLNRYYQARPIGVKLSYVGDKRDRTINLKELPSMKNKITSWKILEEKIPEAISKLQIDHTPILASLKALRETSFSSMTTGKPSASPLRTKSEITINVLWRFLQIRGFVNEKHELTVWGQAMEAALSALDSNEKMEEFVFIAIEMARLGLVHGKDIGNIAGGAQQGNEQTKTMTNLISRVACFGRLKHKAVGYSGPLDRQLLTYGFMITAVRSSLRDLIETVLVSMSLSGDIDRDRSDWSELGLGLPFISDNGCGLAISTRTYLDAVNKIEEFPPPEKTKEEIRNQGNGYSWFQYVPNMPKNLDNAWKLWDAIHTGTQVAGKECKDGKVFAEANEWLSVRR